jgi:hypothetical protein
MSGTAEFGSSALNAAKVSGTGADHFAGRNRHGGCRDALPRVLGRPATGHLAQDCGAVAPALAGCGGIGQRGGAPERCPPSRCASDVHAGSDLPDHGACLRRSRGSRRVDQSLEPKRTGATGRGTRHRQKYLAWLRRAVFKKEADLKPHRNRYWLTAKPDPDFETKCADICAVYQAASTAAEQGVTHSACGTQAFPNAEVQTVSIDEMTGIQALERVAKTLPMKPGYIERREFEYIRHGTKTLIAAFDVTSGKVRGTIGDTRTEVDFVSFLETLFASAPPTTRWEVVCDNLNTHMSEGVVRLVAHHCGIDDELGEKRQGNRVKEYVTNR